MAYVNVAEWSPDQVAEWLKGLDDILQPYIHHFVTKNITGNHLLHLAPDDFVRLNISCIGHQEIILQGIELLSDIHYQIHQENVQLIALRLSSKARSIYNELRTSKSDRKYQNGSLGEEEKEVKEIDGRADGTVKEVKERVSTNILSGVADVLSSVKELVSWLHRTPFQGIDQYDTLKSLVLDLSIRLATIAQRDSFAENPVSITRESCLKLAEIADVIIQDSKDPLVLQPAFLDVVTIKKRADDSWGLGIFTTYHGVHQISMLRALSPMHTCGKLMGGDQVVQVNYQTIVGWTSTKVTQLMQESPTQVILTVKKCPRHVNTITEIYFKPFRLPSKKRTYSPWVHNTIANQRYDLQSIPNLQFIKSCDGRAAAQTATNTEPLPKSMTPPVPSLNSSGSDIGVATASSSDSDAPASDLEDDAFLSEDDDDDDADDDYVRGAPSLSVRLFQPKPRPHVQRRATIPGATARHTLPFDHLLHGYCHRQLVPGSLVPDAFSPEAYVFRAKEGPPESRAPAPARPHTCIGTEKKKKEGERSSSWRAVRDNGEMPFIDESDEKEEEEEEVGGRRDEAPPPPSVSSEALQGSPSTPKEAGGTPPSGGKAPPAPAPAPSPPKSPVVEGLEELKVLRRISDDRPKLDKSYSSPTYDLDDLEASVFLERTPDLKTPKTKSPLANSTEAVDAQSPSDDARPRPPSDATPEKDTPSADSSSILSEPVRNSISSDVTPHVPPAASPPMDPPDLDPRLSTVGALSLSAVQVTVPSAVPQSSVYLRGFKGNRRISCRDLGAGDHHGWLYLRKDSKGFLLSHRWEKRWFILKKSYLYGYRDKDALKADSLIYLPGFRVCPASDAKSKRFSFKIYHSIGATFFFACDTAEERSRWMSQMGVSAISSSSSSTAAAHLHPETEREAVSPEEAYYSETDDELEKSPSTQRPLHATRMSPLKTGRPPGRTPPEGGGPPHTRMSPLGSLSSLAGGKQGLRFLQSSKDALSNPLPTHNFRSYIRVRDPPLSPPPVETPRKGRSPSEGEGKGVRRKGSLRERLRQLPASLTLDRRKGPKTTPPARTPAPLKAGGGASKSETSLLDPPSRGAPKELSPSKSNSQLPSYMRPTHASTLHTEGADHPLPPKEGRRGSIGGLSLSTSSLRSLSPRRGSLDCLVNKGASPPMSPGRSTAGSSGSISAQEEYREGSPEKLWINSLRTNRRPPLSSEGSVGERQKRPPSSEGGVGERLKRAGNYQPVQRGRADPMQLAFELSLSTSPKNGLSPSHKFFGLSHGTPKHPHTPSSHRPQVPPRTKFLSPSERLCLPHSQASPPSPLAGYGPSPSSTVTPLRSKAPPNLTLSPPQEEADSPKTPLKPTMGVSMIGKQRRTPGVMSPREVLPEYPGMEYPPTFEPEIYTLNLPAEEGSYPKEGPARGSPSMSSPPQVSGEDPPQRKLWPCPNQSYVNISHVSNTIAETNVKSYHHSIYVTSPCKDSSQDSQTGGKDPPPLPPNKPKGFLPHPPRTGDPHQCQSSGSATVPAPSDEYVSMGSPSLTYINVPPVTRTPLRKPPARPTEK